LDDQVPWLEGVLAENPHPWCILTFHHPVYSGALGRDNKRLRQTWMPIIDRYKVDLVLQGHDHSYSRSGNLRSGVKVRNDESGTVYVVSVSGPKMYPITGNPLVERFAEDIQLYQTVHIAGKRLEFCAYTITGELYDAFDLEKGPEGINRLVVKVPPGLPERRR
jgi:3',5'-cyclic AMP phosphodiesterase CpdA